MLECFWGLKSRGDRGEVISRHITSVRKWGAWLDMRVVMDNCFKPRPHAPGQPNEDKEVPHVFQMVKGKQLTARHREMMDVTVENEAVYCCVKMYIRDVALSQPPEKVVRANMMVHGDFPVDVHGLAPLTAKQVSTYSKIRDLCQYKYNVPAAAQAFTDLMAQRVGGVLNLTWMSLPPQGADMPEPEGHVYFPYLPKACWNLVVKFRGWSVALKRKRMLPAMQGLAWMNCIALPFLGGATENSFHFLYHIYLISGLLAFELCATQV